jgi:hypothetical protein
MAAQVIISADTFAMDEGLRRGLDAVLLLESVSFLARGQVVVFHRESLAFQQVQGL